jgi:transcriptional regulator with XRE-family HTH domain
MEDRKNELKEMGNHLKALRRAKGYRSPTALAKVIGISNGTYKNYELGMTNMPVLTASRIADALDCSIDELVGREVPFDDNGSVSSAPAPVLKAISKANDSGIKLLADVSKVILNTPELLK